MKNVMNKWTAFFLMAVLMMSLIPQSLTAQMQNIDSRNLEETMRNPWQSDRSIFIKSWLILGSIPSTSFADIDKDFLSDQKGEENINPKEGDVFKISGTEYRWVQLNNGANSIDLRSFYGGGRGENAVAYAFTKVKQEKAGKIYFSVGSDDGIKIWVNGKPVHRYALGRGLNLDQDRVEAYMNEGENSILLKIIQGTGGWGFAVRMFGEDNKINIFQGNIELSIDKDDLLKKTLLISAKGDQDPQLFKQNIQLNIFSAGGKTVINKNFDRDAKLLIDYKNWQDGVYEFRYSYKDIRGVQKYGYTSWFKGDIIAAVKELLKNVPPKEIVTQDALTHRMLADMIKSRLNNNIDKPDSSKFSQLHSPLIEYAEIKSRQQIRAGGFVRLAYVDEVDNTPQFCRSYLPLKYDPNKKWPLVISLHGYNQDNPEIYNWWSSDKRHDGSSDKYDLIFIEPHGRGNTSYTGIGDRDVLKCIEMAKASFNVDEDRIYLMGQSMGGYGTWNVGTRHPDLFAAIQPVYGGGDYHVYTSKENIDKMSDWEKFLNEKSSSTVQLESLINMPVLVTHGDKDASVDVNLSRYLVRMLQRWNYNVKYIEVPGKGHADLGLTDQTMEWLLQQKRNEFPKQVRLRGADLMYASAYWLKVTQKNIPTEFILADAEVMDNNLIRVDTKNVLEYELNISDKLVDLKNPVKVIWNGKVYNFEPGQKKLKFKSDDYNPQILVKTPAVAGPIREIMNTPFMIVKGTLALNGKMQRIINLKADALINDWKNAQKFSPRVKNDVDVTDDDIKKYSLLLVGGPEENEVAKSLIDKLPLKIGKDEITIDSKTFKVQDAALCAIYPNPFNSERYVCIAAGTSAEGFFFFDQRRNDLSEYDYYIIDGKVPSYSKGIKNEKIMVASGFFDYNWKMKNEFLNEGDKKIRDASAVTKVNDDLSTEIIGMAKPTPEQLNAYAGEYQIDGGPVVKVFVENGVLKASANSPVFTPVPVSDNEFFIKEANGTAAFVLDEKTNKYQFLFYQMGREIKSRRLK